MEELKPIDNKLLWELIKNSRRSDRELAKSVGTSQPTVTRRRTRLEKELLEGYTAVPKIEKIGFEIIAFTFVKSRLTDATFEQKEEARQNGRELIMKQNNVILAMAGQGMGWDGMTVSLHRSYSDYIEFKRSLDREAAEFITESQSFIALTDPREIVKPLHFKYLEKTFKLVNSHSVMSREGNGSKTVGMNSLDNSP
jgi:DNA-binding Lrp family transcriptional regulator